MKYKIVPSVHSGRVLKSFYINNIKAEVNDFGIVDWTHPEPNVCKVYFAPHQFTQNDITQLTNKYYISEEEINEIIKLLKETFDGECSACF